MTEGEGGLPEGTRQIPIPSHEEVQDYLLASRSWKLGIPQESLEHYSVWHYVDLDQDVDSLRCNIEYGLYKKELGERLRGVQGVLQTAHRYLDEGLGSTERNLLDLHNDLAPVADRYGWYLDLDIKDWEKWPQVSPASGLWKAKDEKDLWSVRNMPDWATGYEIVSGGEDLRPVPDIQVHAEAQRMGVPPGMADIDPTLRDLLGFLARGRLVRPRGSLVSRRGVGSSPIPCGQDARLLGG